MCKYCNIKDPDDNYKTIAQIQIADVNVYEVGFWVGHRPGFDISSDFDKKKDTHIPMNYCPFCGRKLETEDTQDKDKIDCSKGCLNCINRGCCDYEHINKVDLIKANNQLNKQIEMLKLDRDIK